MHLFVMVGFHSHFDFILLLAVDVDLLFVVDVVLPIAVIAAKVKVDFQNLGEAQVKPQLEQAQAIAS